MKNLRVKKSTRDCSLIKLPNLTSLMVSAWVDSETRILPSHPNEFVIG